MQGNITDWGKEVKKGLIERGWSINDLAGRIGKSRTRVSGVVNGRIYSDSIASAISDLLNIEKASASMKEATRDWCMDARKAMIDLDMNTAELAEKPGGGGYVPGISLGYISQNRTAYRGAGTDGADRVQNGTVQGKTPGVPDVGTD